MKRKYTRKISPITLQSKSDRVKEESNVRLSSDTLPPDILASIEKIIVMRKNLGLFDDSKERIERAIKYQEFIRGRR